MQTTRQLRCDQCGHESDPHYRFCGMCGSRLPSADPLPAAKAGVRDEDDDAATRPVSGPSFLGLADEPSDPVTYLLEDEPGGSNAARLLFVILLLGCLATAGWHWRGTIRGLVMQAMQRPKTNSEPQATSYKTAPISTAGSEVAGAMPNAEAVTPQAEAGNQPATPPPGAAQPNATESTTDQTAASRTGSSDVPGNTPQQANPAQPQSAQTNPSGTPVPLANGNSANSATTKDDSSIQNVNTPKKSAAKKSSNARNDPATQDATNDAASQALEASGEKYLYGNGAPQSCSLAQKNLLAAAESSNARAASVLGTMYATGHCVTRDLPLSYFWFAKAMQQEPNNNRLEQDLTAVWNEMTPDERQVAIHHR